MKHLFAFCLALALVSLHGRAQAQVNTEPLRKRVKVVGYSVILEGSLTGDAGNTQGIAMGGGVGAGWAHDPHLAFVYARADYSRFGGTTTVNKSFAHLRYNYEVTPWAWAEAFAQAQSDQFQRLKLRNLFGVGPRFRVLHADVAQTSDTPPEQDFDVYVGTAYMFERDVISVLPGAPDERVELWHRWSNYLTAHWNFDARASFAETMYVQPAFDDFTNVRLLSETLFNFKVSKLLTASVAGTVRYDSVPPSGVKAIDAEVKNSLALTF